MRIGHGFARVAGVTIAVGVAAGLVVGAGPLLAGAHGQRGASASQQREVVKLKDARLKFEINATDGDGRVQVFIDADSWKTMSILDPRGRRIFSSTTERRMAKQGGTELFLESAEPRSASCRSSSCCFGSPRDDAAVSKEHGHPTGVPPAQRRIRMGSPRHREGRQPDARLGHVHDVSVIAGA